MIIAFYTLGCKVNQYESQILRQQFESAGYEVTDPTQFADIYILNSCTVTSVSDKKTKQILRRFKTINPKSITVLTGCYPQAFPDQASKISEADIITGTNNKNQLINLVTSYLKSKNIADNHIFNKIISIKPYDKKIIFDNTSLLKFQGKTRAFIKIQDGCNRYCSYCIIPKARGQSRSKPLEKIALEAKQLAQNGHQEIVLTGINLSSYGLDFNENINLIDAIKAVSEFKEVKRVRLSSFEPEILSLTDIKRLADIDKFCPHFHLCLQSGCNQTLRRMNRHYTTENYYNIVSTIRKSFDNPSITTDLIVGFPGETDKEFNITLDYINKIKFAKIHVFPYSQRSETPAVKMKDQISNEIKHKRAKVAIKLASEMRKDFLKSQQGLISEVLFETQIAHNLYQGYSKNYTHVIAFSQKDLHNQIREVYLAQNKDDYLSGELI